MTTKPAKTLAPKPAKVPHVAIGYTAGSRLVLELGAKRWSWSSAKRVQQIPAAVWTELSQRPDVAQRLDLGELVALRS